MLDRNQLHAYLAAGIQETTGAEELDAMVAGLAAQWVDGGRFPDAGRRLGALSGALPGCALVYYQDPQSAARRVAEHAKRSLPAAVVPWGGGAQEVYQGILEVQQGRARTLYVPAHVLGDPQAAEQLGHLPHSPGISSTVYDGSLFSDAGYFAQMAPYFEASLARLPSTLVARISCPARSGPSTHPDQQVASSRPAGPASIGGRPVPGPISAAQAVSVDEMNMLLGGGDDQAPDIDAQTLSRILERGDEGPSLAAADVDAVTLSRILERGDDDLPPASSELDAVTLSRILERGDEAAAAPPDELDAVTLSRILELGEEPASGPVPAGSRDAAGRSRITGVGREAASSVPARGTWSAGGGFPSSAGPIRGESSLPPAGDDAETLSRLLERSDELAEMSEDEVGKLDVETLSSILERQEPAPPSRAGLTPSGISSGTLSQILARASESKVSQPSPASSGGAPSLVERLRTQAGKARLPDRDVLASFIGPAASVPAEEPLLAPDEVADLLEPAAQDPLAPELETLSGILRGKPAPTAESLSGIFRAAEPGPLPSAEDVFSGIDDLPPPSGATPAPDGLSDPFGVLVPSGVSLSSVQDMSRDELESAFEGITAGEPDLEAQLGALASGPDRGGRRPVEAGEVSRMILPEEAAELARPSTGVTTRELLPKDPAGPSDPVLGGDDLDLETLSRMFDTPEEEPPSVPAPDQDPVAVPDRLDEATLSQLLDESEVPAPEFGSDWSGAGGESDLESSLRSMARGPSTPRGPQEPGAISRNILPGDALALDGVDSEAPGPGSGRGSMVPAPDSEDFSDETLSQIFASGSSDSSAPARTSSVPPSLSEPPLSGLDADLVLAPDLGPGSDPSREASPWSEPGGEDDLESALAALGAGPSQPRPVPSAGEVSRMILPGEAQELDRDTLSRIFEEADQDASSDLDATLARPADRRAAPEPVGGDDGFAGLLEAPVPLDDEFSETPAGPGFAALDPGTDPFAGLEEGLPAGAGSGASGLDEGDLESALAALGAGPARPRPAPAAGEVSRMILPEEMEALQAGPAAAGSGLEASPQADLQDPFADFGGSSGNHLELDPTSGEDLLAAPPVLDPDPLGGGVDDLEGALAALGAGPVRARPEASAGEVSRMILPGELDELAPAGLSTAMLLADPEPGGGTRDGVQAGPPAAKDDEARPRAALDDLFGPSFDPASSPPGRSVGGFPIDPQDSLGDLDPGPALPEDLGAAVDPFADPLAGLGVGPVRARPAASAGEVSRMILPEEAEVLRSGSPRSEFGLEPEAALPGSAGANRDETLSGIFDEESPALRQGPTLSGIMGESDSGVGGSGFDLSDLEGELEQLSAPSSRPRSDAPGSGAGSGVGSGVRSGVGAAEAGASDFGDELDSLLAAAGPQTPIGAPGRGAASPGGPPFRGPEPSGSDFDFSLDTSLDLALDGEGSATEDALARVFAAPPAGDSLAPDPGLEAELALDPDASLDLVIPEVATGPAPGAREARPGSVSAAAVPTVDVWGTDDSEAAPVDLGEFLGSEWDASGPSRTELALGLIDVSDLVPPAGPGGAGRGPVVPLKARPEAPARAGLQKAIGPSGDSPAPGQGALPGDDLEALLAEPLEPSPELLLDPVALDPLDALVDQDFAPTVDTGGLGDLPELGPPPEILEPEGPMGFMESGTGKGLAAGAGSLDELFADLVPGEEFEIRTAVPAAKADRFDPGSLADGLAQLASKPSTKGGRRDPGSVTRLVMGVDEPTPVGQSEASSESLEASLASLLGGTGSAPTGKPSKSGAAATPSAPSPKGGKGQAIPGMETPGRPSLSGAGSSPSSGASRTGSLLDGLDALDSLIPLGLEPEAERPGTASGSKGPGPASPGPGSPGLGTDLDDLLLSPADDPDAEPEALPPAPPRILDTRPGLARIPAPAPTPSQEPDLHTRPGEARIPDPVPDEPPRADVRTRPGAARVVLEPPELEPEAGSDLGMSNSFEAGIGDILGLDFDSEFGKPAGPVTSAGAARVPQRELTHKEVDDLVASMAEAPPEKAPVFESRLGEPVGPDLFEAPPVLDPIESGIADLLDFGAPLPAEPPRGPRPAKGAGAALDSALETIEEGPLAGAPDPLAELLASVGEATVPGFEGAARGTVAGKRGAPGKPAASGPAARDAASLARKPPARDQVAAPLDLDALFATPEPIAAPIPTPARPGARPAGGEVSPVSASASAPPRRKVSESFDLPDALRDLYEAESVDLRAVAKSLHRIAERQDQEAFEHLKMVIEIGRAFPGDRVARFAEGTVHLIRNRRYEGLAALRRAAELSRAEGDLIGLAFLLEDLFAKLPDDPGVGEALSELYLETNRRQDACEVLLKLGNHALESGIFRDAVGYLEEAYVLDSSPRTLVALLRALHGSGSEARVLELANDFLATRPNSPVVLAHQGIANERLARPEQARRCFDRAFEKAWDHGNRLEELFLEFRDAGLPIPQELDRKRLSEVDPRNAVLSDETEREAKAQAVLRGESPGVAVPKQGLARRLEIEELGELPGVRLEAVPGRATETVATPEGEDVFARARQAAPKFGRQVVELEGLARDVRAGAQAGIAVDDTLLADALRRFLAVSELYERVDRSISQGLLEEARQVLRRFEDPMLLFLWKEQIEGAARRQRRDDAPAGSRSSGTGVPLH